MCNTDADCGQPGRNLEETICDRLIKICVFPCTHSKGGCDRIAGRENLCMFNDLCSLGDEAAVDYSDQVCQTGTVKMTFYSGTTATTPTSWQVISTTPSTDVTDLNTFLASASSPTINVPNKHFKKDV